jgi:hypothetical protein
VRRKGAIVAAAANLVEVRPEVAYQPPRLDELGDVVALTKGQAADDTADMNTARYW